MRKVGKGVFFVVFLSIMLLTALSFVGLRTQNVDTVKTWIKGAADIRWGIDIRGGVDATFVPADGQHHDEVDMMLARDTLAQRLVGQNITDYELYVDVAKNRIIVRFPWKADETDFDPVQALDELGSMSQLSFREGTSVDAMGQPAGELILTGADVLRAEAGTDPTSNQPIVLLTLTSDGAVKFADATGRLVGQAISIWMDDLQISAPIVNERIPGGEAVITGLVNPETGRSDPAMAVALASRINSGALKFEMRTENYSSISPTLGEGAKNTMVLAGVIAFVLVVILMVVRYRLPGVVAAIGLSGQVGLMIAMVTGFFGATPSFTLTLPGIAGIILSIGMGVDANVITAERIREELENGKTIEGAINAGFKRAFTAIFDGNVTVIIVAIILMGAFGPPDGLFAKMLQPLFFAFGPASAGNIYSFGYTLLAGVFGNFVMGVTCSRLMLQSICKYDFARKPWLYGGERV